jgi:hypothetical protein
MSQQRTGDVSYDERAIMLIGHVGTALAAKNQRAARRGGRSGL